MRVAASSSAGRNGGNPDGRIIGILREMRGGLDDVRSELKITRNSVDNLIANLNVWQRELSMVLDTATSAPKAEFS